MTALDSSIPRAIGSSVMRYDGPPKRAEGDQRKEQGGRLPQPAVNCFRSKAERTLMKSSALKIPPPNQRADGPGHIG